MQFGGIKALRDVSIEVPPQSIAGLIGPNGAGKGAAADRGPVGTHPADEGAGVPGRRGRDIHSRAPAGARKGMARTFQQPELFAGLSVRQHLVLAWRIARKRSRLWTDLLLAQAWKPANPAERGGDQTGYWRALACRSWPTLPWPGCLWAERARGGGPCAGGITPRSALRRTALRTQRRRVGAPRRDAIRADQQRGGVLPPRRPRRGHRA